MKERLCSPENLPEIIKPIERLFIANRGEIAVKAINACIKRNISAVVAHSFSESNTLATRMAGKKGWDIALVESYDNQEEILKATLSSGCDTIFLGYGFLAENAKFVKKCEDAGIRVLAPLSETMELTADKIKARQIAKGLNIPVLKGTENLPALDDAIKAASELGFPVMLKISNMGGGKGNRVANDQQELEKAYRELRRRNENNKLFMEHFIEHAVHVEIQIAADKYGDVVSLGERDCTMQRLYQKIAEESPSPHITERIRAAMQKAAINFAKEIGYEGIGTWEFIVDLDRKGVDDKAWNFMEVNPRIQVEHGVTEAQTGIDIINLMMDIAEGKPFPFLQNDIKPEGHTIAVRLYAEDPKKGFTPSPGRISKFSHPANKNIRVDTGVEKGDEMSPWFESIIANVTAHGKTREKAIVALINYLKEVEIDGIKTNKEFLINLLNTPEFRNGEITTSFAEKLAEKLRKGEKKLKKGWKKARTILHG